MLHNNIHNANKSIFFTGKHNIDKINSLNDSYDNKSDDNKSVDIYLADYVDHIATDFTINLTAKMSDNMYIPRFPCLIATRIIGGKFTVYSDITPCDFNYIVFGKRQTIEVEPMKALTCVKGDKDSPYKWI